MRRHRPALAPTIVPTLLLLLGACSGEPSWTGSVEIREGVEVLSNPADPLLADAPGLVTGLWEVPGSEWMDPARVHARSGLVFVVDPPANRVHRVSTSGEVRPSLGRPGGGPGEFLRLLDAIPGEDRLLVLDGGKGSVQYLDAEGNYLASLHLEGQPWAGFLMDDGTLLLKGEFLSDPRAESFGDWVTVDGDGEPRAFTTHFLEPLPEEEGARCSDLSPWAEGAARLRFTTPWIQVFDPAGTLRMESRIALPVEEVTDSERADALSELERRLVERGLPPPFIEQNLIVMEERWRVKCRFGPLRFDPAGRVAAFLEQNPDDFGSGNATLHFLSEDGVYLASAAFPTAWRDFTIEDGVIYALIREPLTDVITLAAFRLDLPETALRDAARALEEARGRSEGDDR
jgi:hypothetical protein